MAVFTFKLPDIGEGIAEAEIVAWHVKVGDRIEEDDPLADMMTDKATVEMTAPVSGIVTKVAGAVGDQIAIGALLAEFEVAQDDAADAEPDTHVERAPPEAGQVARPDPLVEQPAKPVSGSAGEGADTGGAGLGSGLRRGTDRGGSEEPSPHRGEGWERGGAGEAAGLPPTESPLPNPLPGGERGHKVLASPAVRARAKDLGVDLGQVKPSAEGRIRHADLDAFITYNAGGGYRAASAPRPDEAVRVIGLRRRIAENMAASKRAIPHFTYVDEIDVTKLEALRADLNATRGERPKLTLLPLLIVAICKAIPTFPMLNARYDDEAGVVTRHGRVHLGMATQTDAGLMVPVIRDAQDRNVWQLAAEIRRLADAARGARATSAELSGSTLTVTSLGPLGGIATTPVINRPEVAIIGPNKVVERPVFRGGQVVAAQLMNLSISCDHRVVDGWDAASYVAAVKRLLETPALLFVD